MKKTCFNTGVGRCQITWTEYGISGFRLPDASLLPTVASFEADKLDDVPADIVVTIHKAVQMLAGEKLSLADARLDLRNVSRFNKRVYDIALGIPTGKTMTYGEIALALGQKGAAQAVGKALGENPIPLIIPCHRVLAADGTMHGFSAPGGTASKRKLLEIEGAIERPPPSLFDFVEIQIE
ncbi:methylated-DNA--[protein]-cysteine S-methyltransferase [Kordiimonas aestuarii]|uniref:methylated-DNA--[protein]-cysteine S-methyltransferase n=1 Tax=Kordiimonas aestuarii TaxID=1005925 RepID=UPI0021D3E77C|nr:MGMT family protein [Kordiimonas aestuarii]